MLRRGEDARREAFLDHAASMLVMVFAMKAGCDTFKLPIDFKLTSLMMSAAVRGAAKRAQTAGVQFIAFDSARSTLTTRNARGPSSG